MAKILTLNWQDLKHPASGGAEVHLEEILQRLVKKGHEVDLLCCNFPGGKSEEIVNGINIIRRGRRTTFNFIVPSVLNKITKEKKYDIFIEDVNKVPFYTPLYQKMPTIVIFHHLFGGSIFKENNYFIGMYIFLSEKPLAAFYRNKRLIAVSESTASELIIKGLKPEQIQVIHNGLDHEKYSYEPNIKKYERPTLLYVGRIKKYKSIETILDAMPAIIKHVPEIRLVVIGSGDHLPKLKTKVQSMGLSDRVEFKGFVTEQEKVDAYRRSHLLVFPSFKEGWGLTNIEANACGTCVLASRVPGLRDSVDEGKSGLLFEYGDLDEFTAKALKILTDTDFRINLEKGALLHAEKFSWDHAADQTENLINQILSE